MNSVLEQPIDGDTVVGPEKFWLVVCTDARQVGSLMYGHQELTRGYKYVHDTQASAEREAYRLADRYRGYSFGVVESMAVATFKKQSGRVVWDESYAYAWRRSPTDFNPPHTGD